jgi:type I restriction enzyme S subunit
VLKKKENDISWIGDIPDKWKIKKIKYSLIQRTENNNPIRTKNILSLTARQGVIPLSEKECGGNKPKEDYSAYRLAYPGDIVMNSMNVISGSVGLSKYFGCVSPVYYMLRPKDEKDDVRFYNYIFQTTAFQKSLLGLGNGIMMKESGNGKLNTIRMRIPIDKLGNIYIPIADYKEQKNISDFLDNKCEEIDALLHDIQSEIDILEEYKKALIIKAVTKGIDSKYKMKESGVSYIGKMNEKWKLTRLGYICTKLIRSFDSSDIALICTNKGKVSERGDNVIGLMSSDDNAMQGIKEGDIAIHGMDTWHGAIALSKYKGKITRVVHVCDSNEDKRFIVYYLQSLAFRGVYKLISNGVRENTSDFRSWDKTKKIYVTLPNLEEQKRICDYLDYECMNLEKIISIKNKQIVTLEKYKKSLIYEYVTGKRRVQ